MRPAPSLRRALTSSLAGAALVVGLFAAGGVTHRGDAATSAGRATPAAATVGATTPFTSLEAESGTLLGGASTVSLTAAPTTQYSSPALEASGHAYVHLAGTGQGVQWTNTTGQPISFVNVRASIPDAPTGGGITATLDLYVDGVYRQTLNLNSKQSWIYEGTDYNNSDDKNPADGDPRDFWDESHAFVSGAPIAPGSTLSLVKSSSNTAASYDVDVIDVENPPAPIAQPANSLSITSCGAVADNTPTNGSADGAATDSTAAIQNCINQAEAQGRTLWIPQGTFYLKGTAGLQATGITIAGAGMWYSTIYRDVPLPNNQGLAAIFSVTSCNVENFHLDSNAISRGTAGGDGGAMDTTGTNWTADGIWSQHVESGFWASGSGGTVRNSRVTSEWADGINLNNVSLTGTTGSNLTATNNFVRGTGDDAMAINSVASNTNGGSTTYYTAMSNVTLTNNSLIAPWGGKGIGIYGGGGHHVQNNYIADTARYIGLGAGRFGVNGSDLTSATVSGNTVVRSGGNGYGQGQPALQIGNGGDGQNVGVVDSVNAGNNTIVDALYDGIGFSQSTNTTLQNNTVTSPWRNGIVIQPPYYPAPTGSASITGNTVTGLGSGTSPYLNNSSGFTATLSGNSWQGTTPPEGPYGGTPAAIPGTVQAENYDTGGEGVGYHVNSTNGTGNAYRSDGVDLETTTDTGGGYDLGWTSGGQWFRYTVDVATAGTYTVALRVAAPSAVTAALHLANAAGTNLSGAVDIPQTGGWQNWTTVTATVTLPAGQQVLTLNQDNGGWNADDLAFTGSSGPAALTASPSSLTFGPVTAGTTSAAQTVTVTNPGGVAATITSVGVSGPFSQTNTCGTSLAAGASCTVSVQFSPTTSGAASGTLSVAGSAPNSPLNVGLSGTGTAANTNLALNRPTTASGYVQTYAPANAVDGNTSSYWESTNNAFPQWIQVDLGSTVGVGRIVMDLPPSTSWGARTQTILIQGSTDGTSYATVAPSQGYTFDPNTGNTVTVTFASAGIRYLKLTFTGNTGWPAGQLSELQVFAS
ncbi:discoidin domain-containing protein [Streptacidiphilus anmyonensis]|uniref:discoidin domain-containing protein n=1 Tax=Streptacidiphilus anmyonensis TaxID=405782 RepID=UPI0009FDA1A9|nr:discoidin domain-containing protein [Streptacidiphilus anmyonensis]